MEVITEIEQQYRKPKVAHVQSGDTVRVHQLIREGSKKRVQVFEGVVIRTHRPNELTAVITVRRVASGIGVEKTFLLHSPNVQKVEVVRRAKVRRNFLSYLRGRRGKSARLQELGFDRAQVNVANAEPEEAKMEDVSDEELDVELTELPSESVQVEESIEEVAKEETKAASAEDEPSTVGDPETGEENQLAGEEFKSGVEKAENEDDRAQKTT